MRPAASHHLPDSPFADFHLRAVSVNDAAALAALLQSGLSVLTKILW